MPDGIIESRPMKGTAPRGATKAEDAGIKKFLRNDPKNQAENRMIVDLLRNDISRISEVGTLDVPELFAIETYPTVHQMVSTVRARLLPDLTIAEIFAALFPCGSITGAPKIRAMEVIRALETTPRDAYCGAIGWICAGRTDALQRRHPHDLALCRRRGGLQCRRRRGVRFVGRGGVCGMSAESAVRDGSPAGFDLIETMRWEPGAGFVRFERHLARLYASARELGFAYDPQRIGETLKAAIADPAKPLRTRLVLSADGDVHASTQPFEPLPPNKVWNLRIAHNPPRFRRSACCATRPAGATLS